MYTAKITNKQKTPRGIEITVEFTDGTETVTHTVIPQDRAGFDHWLKGMITSLNEAALMEQELTVGETLSVEPPAAPEPTPEDIERDTWIALWNRYKKAEQAMDALKRAGVEPTPEETAAFNALLSEVAAKRKPEYYAYI